MIGGTQCHAGQYESGMGGEMCVYISYGIKNGKGYTVFGQYIQVLRFK